MIEPIKVAVFSYSPLIEPCTLDFASLEANQSHCPQVGIGAEVLGNALRLARIPYQLVPIRGDWSIGMFDEKSGNWTGEWNNVAPIFSCYSRMHRMHACTLQSAADSRLGWPAPQ